MTFKFRPDQRPKQLSSQGPKQKPNQGFHQLPHQGLTAPQVNLDSQVNQLLSGDSQVGLNSQINRLLSQSQLSSHTTCEVNLNSQVKIDFQLNPENSSQCWLLAQADSS